MTTKVTRRTVLKGAAGAAAGTAALGAAKRSTAFAAPAVVQQTGSKVKVVYWSSFTAVNAEAMDEAVRRFNESQQEVEIENQFQGTYDETAQKLRAALTSNTTPDMTLLSEANWFPFYLNRALAPLNDLMAANEFDTADFVESFLNEGNRNGTQWWMSFARSTPLFYYNKAMWAEAGLPDRGPETYAELREWAPSLVKKEGDNVSRYAFSHAPSTDFIAWYFQGTIWAHGGQYSDDQFNITLTEPPGIEAGTFYRDSVVEGWAHVSQDRRVDFYNGVTASLMQSTGSLGTILQNSQFEVGTGFLPKAMQPGCPTGGAGLAILANTPQEKQEAAFKFITFLTSTEITTWWSQTTGYMPVRKSAIESPEMQTYYQENPNFRTAVEQLPTTQPQDPARIYIPGGDRILGGGLERILINQEEVQAAFEDVRAELEEEAEPIREQLQEIEG